jgi:hypothetical protein
MSKFAMPQVNMNGTSVKELQEQQHAIFCAAYDLRVALRENGPHGRDYQTAEPGTYEKAREEHAALIEAAELVIHHTHEVNDHLYKSGGLSPHWEDK